MDDRFSSRVRGGLVLLVFAAVLLSGLVLVPETGSADEDVIQPSSKDSTVLENNPDANFGGLQQMDAGCVISGGHRRAFVAWIVSISDGSTIIDAQMELYLSIAPDVSQSLYASRITVSWTEGGITWNDQPSSTGLVSTPSGTTDGVWIAWNITAFVDDWVNGEEINEGVRILVPGDTCYTDYDSVFLTKEHGTSSTRPKLTITYTPVDPEPNFVVQIAGGLTDWPAQVDTNITISIELYNTGELTLNVVWIQIINHTDVMVVNRNESNLLTSEDADNPRTFDMIVPSSANTAVGSFAWYLNGTYEASDPDTEYSWPFTLNVQTDPIVAFFAVEASLDSTLLPIDTTTRLEVRITSSADTTAIQYFNIYVTSTSLISSPDNVGVVVEPNSVGSWPFNVFAMTQGYHALHITVVPIDRTSGLAIGYSRTLKLMIRVTEASSIITFSASDIGLRDAILTGKINSLGGYESACVWFTLWETNESVDTADTFPPNGRVVSFVSDFRVWVGGLAEMTDYSYEFRMAIGPGTGCMNRQVQIYGGIVEFSTTEEWTDPVTAIRNGLAEWLGLDSIIVGFMLGGIVVLLVIILMVFIVRDRLEGNAALIAIIIPGWVATGAMFAMGWFPVWLLVTIMVVCAAIIIGLPQFGKGKE